MPEWVDKEEFIKLEGDEEFLQALSNFAKSWLEKKDHKVNL